MARERYYITRNHPMLMGLQGTAVWISKYSSLSNALRDVRDSLYLRLASY